VIDTIFFDAGGTLIEVAEPVGETYARAARAEGARASAATLSSAFRAAFAAAPPLAFPGAAEATLRGLERAWWRERVLDTFTRAGVGLPPSAFERVFEAAFEHFARGAAWRIFDDVRPTLDSLRRRGLRLAVVSNFDARLRTVLSDLDLAAAFDAVVLSTECGFAKPDPRIFDRALELTGGRAASTLHVGDSVDQDVEGARAAGISAGLIDRSGSLPDAIPSLAAIAARFLD
jgi:putative hydrolase of the HAD superfamily